MMAGIYPARLVSPIRPPPANLKQRPNLSVVNVTAREAEYIMGSAYTRPQTHMHQDSDAANAQLQISEEAGMLYDPTEL